MSKVSEVASSQDQDKLWFVYVPAEAPETKGQRLGPFSERDFVCMYRTKQLTSRTYVWKTGMKDWNRLYTVDKLREVIQKANDEDEEENIEDEEEEQKETKEETKKEEEKKQEGGDLESELTKEIEKMLEKGLEEEQEMKKLLKKRKYEGKTDEEIKKYEEARKRKKKEYNKRKKQSKWYAPRINSNIYVEGLPPDITFQEFDQFVQACGIIRVDPNDGKKKLKIYRNEDGSVKGDGMASYMRHESIELAIEMLNGKEIKPGYPVKVSKVRTLPQRQAEFEQKGEQYEARHKQQNKLEKIRIKQQMDNKLTWNEEDDFSNDKGLKIVVMEHMYTLEDAADQSNIRELREEILEECEKLGPVEKCELYPHNPKGVVKLKFASSKAANECIELMSGRFFDGREVKCHYWDGKTDYKKVKETQSQTDARIQSFGKWLEQNEEEPKTEEKGKDEESEEKIEGPKNGQ